jgi:predicted porin
MKSKFMAAAAVVAILTASGVAHAETNDIAALKAQSAALKKQNAALEARLNKLEKQQTAQQQVQQKQAAQIAAAPAPTSFMAADLSSLKGPLGCALPSLEGPLTFCGITLFGTVDAGVGWVSHGLPESGQLYVGESLINKNYNHSYFGIAPNNLSQTTLGIKGAEDLGFWGLSGVFMASTGINPQSGQLANAPGSVVNNNGLNRLNFSNNGDGSRGGQAFNDQLYVGLASPTYGQLTFGRHRSLSTDEVIAYDPMGGSYAFSPIGYSGTPVSGLGDTAASRWDDSFKYRLEYGPVHAGAMYKFADGTGGSNDGLGGTVCPTTGTQPAAINGNKCAASTLGGTFFYPANNYAYQFNLGGTYWGFDVDGTFGYYNNAISTGSPLTAAQLAGASTFTSNTGKVTNTIGAINNNTMAGTVSDNYAAVIAAKYTWNQFKLFAGYAYVNYSNPSQNVGIGADNLQGGYILSTVTNNAYPNNKVLQTEWAGVKYAYDPRTDFTVAYYHEGYSQYATTATLKEGVCNHKNSQNLLAATCAGDLNAVSVLADYHFTKRFDVFAGMMVTNVSGGFASGFLYYTNWAPTAGARFTF